MCPEYLCIVLSGAPMPPRSPLPPGAAFAVAHHWVFSYTDFFTEFHQRGSYGTAAVMRGLLPVDVVRETFEALASPTAARRRSAAAVVMPAVVLVAPTKRKGVISPGEAGVADAAALPAPSTASRNDEDTTAVVARAPSPVAAAKPQAVVLLVAERRQSAIAACGGEGAAPTPVSVEVLPTRRLSSLVLPSTSGSAEAAPARRLSRPPSNLPGRLSPPVADAELLP